MTIKGWIILIALIVVVLGINILLIVYRDKIKAYFEKRRKPASKSNQDDSFSKLTKKVKEVKKGDFLFPESEHYKRLRQEMDRLENLERDKDQK
ncbi:MAG TPA: hypothetical protein PKJ88_06190 [Flexilinea sp.]|nr:hypothetical protein [Flexilinea sp.]